jgi:putative ABC transport system permease protein
MGLTARLSDAVYRLALRLFPRDVRRRSAEQMVELFCEQRRLVRGRPVAIMTLWGRAIGDCARHGLAMRFGRASADRPSGLHLGYDLRDAVRLIRRRRGVATLVVTTLAIGIAGATIVFSVADAILWHPLPFPHADRFARVRLTLAPGAGALSGSGGALEAWSGKERILDGLYPFRLDSAIVDVGDEPRAVALGELSVGLLDTLGVTPIWGRTFSADEYRAGAGVVLVSAELWRRAQGVGRATTVPTLLVDGVRQVIVGVMPDGFAFPFGHLSMWRPYPPNISAVHITALGTLKPGVSWVEAETVPRPTSSAGRVRDVVVSRFVDVDTATSTALHVLVGAVAMLLLIAVANAANVLMSEAVRRDTEFAVRTALGASSWRLARQMVLETLVISAVAALVALLLSAWVLGAVAASVPFFMSYQALRPIALDARALTCAGAVATLAGLGSTSFAILRARRIEAPMALRGQTSGLPTHGRVRRVLTAAQIAVTLALLASAAVLGRSFLSASRSNAGVDPDHVVQLVVQVPTWRSSDESTLRATLDDVRAKAARLPDVLDATIAYDMPPLLGSRPIADLTLAGSDLRPGAGTVWFGRVDDTFFPTLGIPLLAGRGVDTHDRPDTPPVAVVSRALAERLWPNGDALGRRFRESPDDPWRTVVGIVGNVTNVSVDQSRGLMAFYTPRLQIATWWFEGLIVRTRPAAAEVVPALRAVLRSSLPDAPIREVLTGRDMIRDSSARERFATALMTAFAGAALVLALIGVYGAFWFSVRQRTREIGVRLALGASPAMMLRMVLGASLRLILIGLTVGIPLAFAATRALRSLVFDISPSDPATLGVVTICLAVAALAATYVPARWAARIAPVDVLRQV